MGNPPTAALSRPHGPGAYLSLPGHLAPPVIRGWRGWASKEDPWTQDTGQGDRHSPFNLRWRFRTWASKLQGGLHQLLWALHPIGCCQAGVSSAPQGTSVPSCPQEAPAVREHGWGTA